MKQRDTSGNWRLSEVTRQLINWYGGKYRVAGNDSHVGTSAGCSGTIHDEKLNRKIWFSTYHMDLDGKISLMPVLSDDMEPTPTLGRLNYATPKDFPNKVRNLFIHGKFGK